MPCMWYNKGVDTMGSPKKVLRNSFHESNLSVFAGTETKERISPMKNNMKSKRAVIISLVIMLVKKNESNRLDLL